MKNLGHIGHIENFNYGTYVENEESKSAPPPYQHPVPAPARGSNQLGIPALGWDQQYPPPATAARGPMAALPIPQQQQQTMSLSVPNGAALPAKGIAKDNAQRTKRNSSSLSTRAKATDRAQWSNRHSSTGYVRSSAMSHRNRSSSNGPVQNPLSSNSMNTVIAYGLQSECSTNPLRNEILAMRAATDSNGNQQRSVGNKENEPVNPMPKEGLVHLYL